MKRILACSLAIILAFSVQFSSCAETIQTVPFDATCCNAMDKTSSAWYATSEMRCAFALFIMMDFMNDTSTPFKSGDWDYSKPCAIAKVGTNLVLIIQSSSNMYMLIYSPMTEEAYYVVYPQTTDSESLMKFALQSMDQIDRYEILDVEEIYEVAQKIQNYL